MATVPGSIKANSNKALIHNCIGKILSIGSVGNKNDISEKKPLIAKNAKTTIINLFMIYNKYIILLTIRINLLNFIVVTHGIPICS